MTLPTVINSYNKKAVETRLARFYTMFNQAIEMSIAENGDMKYWYQDLPSFLTQGDDGQWTSEGLVWFNKYIGKYMPISKVSPSPIRTPMFYLNDGSVFLFMNEGTTRDYFFYTKDPGKCLKQFGGNTSEARKAAVGKCAFAFIFDPTSFNEHKNKGLEPYAYGWNGTTDELYQNCKSDGGFCTKLIQINGWKIPKDYPHKVYP